MKKLLLVLMLSCFMNVFAQEEVELQNFSIAVKVESLEELDELDMDEIVSIFKTLDDFENVSFELSCEFDQVLEKGTLNHSKFNVEGTTEALDEFLEKINNCKSVINKLYKR